MLIEVSDAIDAVDMSYSGNLPQEAANKVTVLFGGSGDRRWTGGVDGFWRDDQREERRAQAPAWVISSPTAAATPSGESVVRLDTAAGEFHFQILSPTALLKAC
jgi:hypothetical protein